MTSTQRPKRSSKLPIVFAFACISTAWILLISTRGFRNANVVDAFSFLTTQNRATGSSSSRPMTILRSGNNLHPFENGDDDDQETAPRKNPNTKDSRTNFLLAAAFVAATLGGNPANLAANAVDDPSSSSSSGNLEPPATTTKTSSANVMTELSLVSPGTTFIETKVVHQDHQALLQSTKNAVKNLAQTAFLDAENRVALTDSVQRLKSSVQNEFTSVEAWQQVFGVLRDYGIDLQKETDVVIRPPSDWRRTYDDWATKQQLSFLVNGEILQVTLHYEKGINDLESFEQGGNIQPDDEWILRVRGYKGFDPNAINLALEPAPEVDYTPQWLKNWNTYWDSNLEESDVSAKIFGTDKTHGDAIVIEGTAAIALSYVVSYAYYVGEIEKAAEEARQKQAKKEEFARKKKEASKATKAKKTDSNSAGATKKDVTKTKTMKPTRKEEKAPASQKQVETSTSVIKPKYVGKNKDTKAPSKPLSEGEDQQETKNTTEIRKDNEASETQETETDDSEDNVKVLIDFDKDGKVVLKAIESLPPGQRKNGVLPLLQALYLPWLGFFFEPTATVGKEKKRPSIVAFVQALYFPWGGIFFPKNEATMNDPMVQDDIDSNTAAEGRREDEDETTNGLLPFVRALWFPWIGLLTGK